MDNNPVERSPEGDPKKPQTNFFEDILFSIIAGVALLFWDLTTKRLLTGTYRVTEKHGDRTYSEANPLNLVIGVLLSLIGGIAVGYNLWWIGGAPFLQWAPWALGTTAFIAIYGWTSVYMVAIKYAFKWSEKLWSHVNVDASYDRSERSNPVWFSRALMGISMAGIVITGFGVLYEVACYVQAHQGGWGWLGWVIGMIAAVLSVVIAIVVLIIIGLSSRSFKVPFWLGVLGAIALWWFWVPVAALFGGLYSNLTGGPWGAWGYVPGGLVGIIAGLIVGAIGFTLLLNFRLRLVAAVTSVAATWYFADYTNGIVSQIPLFGFDIVAPVLPWIAYALELLVFAGFAFPILHIAISHGLRKLANVLDLFEDVYGESRGGYREFFLQVANIAGTAAVVWYGPALVTTFLGLTALYAVWPIVIAAALFTYIVLGKLLDATGSWPFGVATSGWVGMEFFAYYHSHYEFGGWIANWGFTALAAAVNFFILFPVAYLIVRWVLNRAWLAGFVRDGLVNFHNKVCKSVETLVEELFEAAEKTYNDRTPYREVGVHLTNIVVALAVLGGTIWGGFYLEVASWLTFGTAGVLTMVSYGAFGKLLLNKGMKPVGYLVAAVSGVLLGVFVHGAQPEVWGYYRFIASVIGGLFGAAVTHGILFPWLYLFIRAIINVTSPETWLRPLLMSIHETYSKFFGQFGRKFMVKYRLFQERLASARARFAERYAAFQQRFADRNKK